LQRLKNLLVSQIARGAEEDKRARAQVIRELSVSWLTFLKSKLYQIAEGSPFIEFYGARLNSCVLNSRALKRSLSL
jgi:hypothetical protein